MFDWIFEFFSALFDALLELVAAIADALGVSQWVGAVAALLPLILLVGVLSWTCEGCSERRAEERRERVMEILIERAADEFVDGLREKTGR